jgi:hypothetical protein
MEFRVLEEGPGINLTQTTNSVVIEVDPNTLPLPTLPGLIDLSRQVTGILPVVNGGTGSSTPLGARQNLLAAGSIVNMGGTSLVHAVAYNPTTTNLQVKGLTSDPEVTLTENANDVRLGINQAMLNLGSIGGQISLTSQVTGVLPITNGGTGASNAGQALDNLNGLFSARSLGGTTILGTPIIENVPGSGERLLIKGISNGTGTVVTDLGTSLSVDIAATNVGTGTGTVLKTPIGTSLSLRTITGAAGITVATVGDEITISGSGAASNMVSVGTGQPVLVTPLGNPIQFRSIVGRFGLSDSIVGQDVVLDFDGVNVGAGQGIFVAPVAASNTSAQYKSLSAVTTNPGLVVTSTATEVQFQAIVASAANLGTGATLLANPNPTTPGSTLNFRSIIGTNGILHTQNASDVTLSLNAINVGGAAETLITPIVGTAQLRTISDGGGISVAQEATNIRVSFEGLTLGAGSPIYIPAEGSGPAQFRSIVGGVGVTAVTNPTDVTLDLDVINVGGGSEVLVTPLAGPVQFRTLVEGNGINLAQAATSITVAADLANLGAGVPILVPGATHNFKSLIAGAGITLTPTATDVTLAATVAGAINVGATPIAPATATAQVLANGPITTASTVAQFKSITSSDNSVTITQTATQINLRSNNRVVAFHTTAATFTDPGSVTPNVQNITHNLGTNQIMVQVRNSSGEVLTNYRVVPGPAGSNTVGISWGSPTAVPVGACTVFVTGILP